jgi:hypothetical protein
MCFFFLIIEHMFQDCFIWCECDDREYLFKTKSYNITLLNEKLVINGVIDKTKMIPDRVEFKVCV